MKELWLASFGLGVITICINERIKSTLGKDPALAFALFTFWMAWTMGSFFGHYTVKP